MGWGRVGCSSHRNSLAPNLKNGYSPIRPTFTAFSTKNCFKISLNIFLTIGNCYHILVKRIRFLFHLSECHEFCRKLDKIAPFFAMKFSL